MGSTTLSDAERERAIEILRRSYAEFERLTAGLDHAGWVRKRSADEWSVVEIAEHLIFIEKRVIGAVLPRLMATEVVDCDAEAELLRERTLFDALAAGKERVEAPAAVRPVGACASGEQACLEFRAAREASIEYVTATQEALRAHRFPHPLLGPLDGYQWVLMVGAHTLRHNRQIERTIAGQS
jgi:hypothetical protein